MKGTRILRYVGNREKPEKSLYSPFDRTDEECVPIPALGLTYPEFISFRQSVSGLYLKPIPMSFPSFSYSYYPWEESPKTEPPPEIPFEVNMMEALVGWKTWCLEDGKLHSVQYSGICWPVDEPLVATCPNGCTEVPRENHTCGIYASDNRPGAESYIDDGNEFVGLVYGWGRYVRASGGWRSQLAYPKCFYLNVGQVELIEKLKAYHVPIYISQPTLIYNPEEDGYEHRGEEADGDCRTYQESFANEEDGSGDEEDY